MLLKKILLACCFACDAEAQVFIPAPEGDTEIDNEYKDLETGGDILAYRYSDYWNSLRRDAQAGYRTSAGSLDINRFYLSEEIWFSAFDPKSPGLELGFRQRREEDLVEERITRELRIIGQRGLFYGGLVGASGTYKKWGDLGGVVGLRNQGSHAEVSFISVDHYFQAKDEELDSSYHKQPWTAALDIDWGEVSSGRLAILAAWSHPVTWQRRNYQYDLFRREAVALYEREVAPKWITKTSVNHDRKVESRHDIAGKASLERSVTIIDLAVRHLGENVGVVPETRAVGLRSHVRKAYFHDKSRSVVETQIYYDEERPTWSSSAQRWGVQGGHVRATDEIRADLKALYGIEWQATARGHLRLTATFDVDRMISLFPYKKERPGWDGGNFQFLMVF